MKKIFFFLAALMLSFTAQATIVECNPGTNNLAWYLTQGDTLVLADGIYEEAYSIDFTKPGVCVKAAEGAKPVIKLTGEWTALEVTATTTFDGITFDAGNVAQYIIATLDSTTFETDLTIKNCEFKNWNHWAISHYYQKNVSVNSVVIDNCLFHDAKNSAVYFSENAPEGKNACQDLKITNSTFYNIGDASAYTTVHCVGGNAVDAQKVTINYCTFYNCQAKNTDHAAVRITCAATISNTIIAAPASQGTYRAIHATDGSNAQAINCLTYNYEKDNGGIRSAVTKTDCQLNVDPKFVDAANGNFALDAGSPALGAATDGSNLGDPRWNVVTEPEPVLYNVTVTAENGTVTGAGEYEEGKEATLTATPAEGYQFVNWTKGEEVVSTENPYTFTVTADIALVANFELIPVVEPEKPEPTYTENKLNPYAFGLESKLSEDGSVLNVTYRLNNSNATSVNVVVYNGEKVVATVPAPKTIGKNTVEVATAELPKGVELKWAVEVNGTSVEVPTQETKIYSFYHPSGLDIDNNPENETFGMLLINEGMQAVKGSYQNNGSPYVSTNLGAGIFAFTPSFDLIPNGELPGYNGGIEFTTGRADAPGSTAYSPRRIRISEDGRIFVTSLNTDGNYLWEVNPANMNEWTPVFKGTLNEQAELIDADGNFVAAPNSGFDVKGAGENLQLAMYSANIAGIGTAMSGFRLHEYNLGTATEWATAPSKAIVEGKYAINYTGTQVEYDNEGGLWICSYRGTASDANPGLVHINADGVEDAKLVWNNVRQAGIRFNKDFTKLVVAGNNGAAKKATIYTISKDANGAPVLTQEAVVDMAVVGNNLNDFAWDYAGNLYSCGNSSEKLAAWAMPYSGKVSTPAAAKYAFQLEGTENPDQGIHLTATGLETKLEDDGSYTLQGQAVVNGDESNLMDFMLCVYPTEGYTDAFLNNYSVMIFGAPTPGAFVENTDGTFTYTAQIEDTDGTVYNINISGTIKTGGSEYTELGDKITNMTFDTENMVITGGPSAEYAIKVVLKLGEDNLDGTYTLSSESSVTIRERAAEFVEGYVYNMDLSAPSAVAVVKVNWDGMKYEFTLRMSAPVEATKVVVENATIEINKYLLFGDTYDYALKMTGNWLNPEDGLTYPVLVDVPVYYPEATEPSSIHSTVTVGGWGDDDPWLGFGEGELTITTVGNTITATGVVENPMNGIAIDITISGSKTPTAIDNATITVKPVKVIKNGQLIIINNDVEYSAQGQVIK